MSIYKTPVALAPSFSYRHSTSQFRPAQPPATTHPSSGTLTHYPADFGKWMEFLGVCWFVVNTLLSRVGCPFQWLRKKRWGDRTRDKSMCADNEICDAVWTQVFSRPQTGKENELEGKGLRGCIFSVWFVFADPSDDDIYPPEPYFFFLFSQSLLIVL